MMLWFYEPSHITSTCLTSHQPSPEHIHLPHVTTACLVSPQPAHIVPTHPVSDKPIPYHMDPSHSTPSHPTSGQFTSHHTNHDAYTLPNATIPSAPTSIPSHTGNIHPEQRGDHAHLEQHYPHVLCSSWSTSPVPVPHHGHPSHSAAPAWLHVVILQTLIPMALPGTVRD